MRGASQQPASTNAGSHVYARLLYTAIEYNRSPAAASVSVPSLQSASPASPHPTSMQTPHLQRAVVRVDAVPSVVHSEVGQRCHHERQLRGQETRLLSGSEQAGVGGRSQQRAGLTRSRFFSSLSCCSAALCRLPHLWHQRQHPPHQPRGVAPPAVGTHVPQAPPHQLLSECRLRGQGAQNRMCKSEQTSPAGLRPDPWYACTCLHA